MVWFYHCGVIVKAFDHDMITTMVSDTLAIESRARPRDNLPSYMIYPNPYFNALANRYPSLCMIIL